MKVADLWTALHQIEFAHQQVAIAINNEPGIVVYGVGQLKFTAGNLDQLVGKRRPDRLNGTTVWSYSDRTFVYGQVGGFGGPRPRSVGFDPDATDSVEIGFARSLAGVTASVRVPWGSTTFAVAEQGDVYVGAAQAIGGTGQMLYTFAFPGQPTTVRPPA
jgi:hypothetical protein